MCSRERKGINGHCEYLIFVRVLSELNNVKLGMNLNAAGDDIRRYVGQGIQRWTMTQNERMVAGSLCR
jgi:hypothetical protein